MEDSTVNPTLNHTNRSCQQSPSTNSVCMEVSQEDSDDGYSFKEDGEASLKKTLCGTMKDCLAISEMTGFKEDGEASLKTYCQWYFNGLVVTLSSGLIVGYFKALPLCNRALLRKLW